MRRLVGIWDRTGKAGLHEAALVVVAFLIYFLVRGAVIDRADLAFENARRLIDIERSAGLYREATLQSWVIDHYWLVRALNIVYFWGHMPLIIVAAAWLWIGHRSQYVITRNAFLISGAIGVVVYWLVPLAPPRLLPETGLVDTLALYDQASYNAQETRAFVNPYAALPSLHFGWAMLLGGVVAWVAPRREFVVFGIAWPVAMLASIVMTGNHFIADAIAGALVCLVGLAIAQYADRRWPHIFRRLGPPLVRTGPGRGPARTGDG